MKHQLKYASFVCVGMPPSEEIPGAFQELKPCLLEEANEVTY